MQKAIPYILVVMSTWMIAGCYKADTLYPNKNSLVNKQVSFANDIIPILNQKCSMSGCHGSGGHTPDLTASRAYYSLINGGFINTTEPANSKLYLRLIGKVTPAMPMGSTSNPSNLNALVLTWITQQARNN